MWKGPAIGVTPSIKWPCFSTIFCVMNVATLPPIIMANQLKMGVSPILASFHLGWFSTEPWLWEKGYKGYVSSHPSNKRYVHRASVVVQRGSKNIECHRNAYNCMKYHKQTHNFPPYIFWQPRKKNNPLRLLIPPFVEWLPAFRGRQTHGQRPCQVKMGPKCRMGISDGL